MEDKSKLKPLLFMVAILVTIKFALLPVIAWQGEMMDEIAAVEKRNNKAERLLEQQQELFMQVAQTNKAYKEKADAFPTYPDSASFRLESQMMFEQVLKMDDLKTKRFFWRNDTDSQIQGNLYMGSFNITVYGLAKDFALLQSKLANSYQEYRIPNMGANLSGFSEKSLGKIEVTFTVEAYYWLRGAN